MKITINRGTDEIGATCIEVRTAKHSIFIDAGLPLDDSPASLPESIARADALFISHGHLDHSGLLEMVPAHVPVYFNEVARAFNQASKIFRNDESPMRLTQPITANETVCIGDISVTAILMDHSAPEAFGFLVRSGNKSLFYTGDFRAHGRKSALFWKLIENPPLELDALILEGTLFDRSNAEFPDESSVEMAMTKSFKDEANLAYVVCSAQNIDRLVTVFRAAKKSRRTLVIDLYTAWILEVFGRFHKSTPRMEWEGIMVLAHGRWASRHYGVIKEFPEYFTDFKKRVYSKNVAIRSETINTNPGNYVLKVSRPITYIDHFRHVSATVVYSLWEGYLRAENNVSQASEFSQLMNRPDVSFSQIHTSGHADINTLKLLSKSMNPKKLIPIHTVHKHLFPEQFDNVVILNDGESVTI